MNRLDIQNGNSKYSLAIDKYKFILCNNLDKYKIKQAFRKTYSKSKSENRKENGECKHILLNEQYIDIKRSLFFEVDSNYSIVEDSKLNSKSLMLKYIEAKYNNIQFFDTINTLNILLESLADEINEDDKLNVLFNYLNYKSLSKLTDVYYFDETQKDEFDLTYDEVLMFQMELIEYISLVNKEYENIFVLLDMDYLSLEIINRVKSMKKCTLLVLVNEYKPAMEDKICLINNESIDLENVEEFYNLYYQRASKIISVREVKDKMMNIIAEDYTVKEQDVVNKLIRST